MHYIYILKCKIPLTGYTKQIILFLINYKCSHAWEKPNICNSSSSFHFLLKVLMLLYSLFIQCWWMSTTCLHSYIPIYSNLTLIPNIMFPLTRCSIMNTRLVTMSVSLCTQTVLHCLIIQVLTTGVWFLNIWYTSLTSVHSNLEHGLVILTESFSPLRSVLHNLPFWFPKLKSTSIDTQYNSMTSVALHNIN